MKTYEDNDVIAGFFGDYHFLSNFHPSPLCYKGFVFPCVEHAYQIEKMEDDFNNPNGSEKAKLAKKIADKPASYAKKVGKSINMRSDWDEVKWDIMFELVLIKFLSNHHLRQPLIDTHPKTLIEANYWGDTYWGMVYDKNNKLVGENNLGGILLDIRDFFILRS